MTNDWEEKARQRALANSETRMENHGRVHIGNGKWMDQAEIDAIAQARLQPTLDEISDKAEKRRAEDAERQFELEKKKRQEQEEKARQAEIKAEEKKGKGNSPVFNSLYSTDNTQRRTRERQRHAMRRRRLPRSRLKKRKRQARLMRNVWGRESSGSSRPDLLWEPPSLLHLQQTALHHLGLLTATLTYTKTLLLLRECLMRLYL
jgi:hypothetical protein